VLEVPYVEEGDLVSGVFVVLVAEGIAKELVRHHDHLVHAADVVQVSIACIALHSSVVSWRWQHGTAALHSQHSTAQHKTAQHSTAQHSTAQNSTAQHSTAQHSTAQNSTAQHCALSCEAVRGEAVCTAG
jgi:hypothetical protein